ncbi:MAG: sulfite oxidase [Candidatus Hydrothermarchaeales archaeon]
MERYSRREFISKLVGAVLALYLSSGCLIQKSEVRTKKRATTGALGGHPTPELTTNEEFYLTNFNGIPKVNIKSWSLLIDGLVEHPLNLKYEDITSMSSVSKTVTLICIGNGIGGELIGNAEWVGVPMKSLLEKAGVKSRAVDVVLYGEEGYSDSLPIEKAMDEDTMLAYKMNGEILPRDHGYPLRAVVPGIYGMKNVKWLKRIEVVDNDYKGHWEKQGWSDSAVIKLMSRIDAPVDKERITQTPYTIAGIAYGGLRGVLAVEVSTDGGRTWDEAVIKEPLSKYAWTLWTYQWKPASKGKYEISVRATDKEGNVQKKGNIISRRVYPSGADGIHSIKVDVERL